jgi:hypothetical protein
MSGRLAHEIAGHDQFADYFANHVPLRMTEKNKQKIYKELGTICNYPSHKYNVDCENQCDTKTFNEILSLKNEFIHKSNTLKTIYLETLRDYEKEYKIEINDNNVSQ